jgi:hypothetical protein
VRGYAGHKVKNRWSATNTAGAGMRDLNIISDQQGQKKIVITRVF